MTFDDSYDRAMKAVKKKRRPMSEYQKEQREERKQVAPFLDGVVMNYILDSYEKYGSGLLRKEPCISAVEIREMTGSLGDAPDRIRDMWRLMTKSEKLTAINSSLQRLKRQGKLQSSLGFNMFGQEAKCFEPAE